jgi:hypothetical protein
MGLPDCNAVAGDGSGQAQRRYIFVYIIGGEDRNAHRGVAQRRQASHVGGLHHPALAKRLAPLYIGDIMTENVTDSRIDWH